jgi:hypothetical protein
MPRIRLPRWWGYLDDRGVVHIKRYTNDKAIQNCEQMPFTKGIFDPFEAVDYAHARAKIAKFLDEQQFHEKKLS